MNAPPVVVDASVAVKWVITAEEYAAEAAALLADALVGEVVVVPPHFPGEVANAIYQRVNSRDPGRHISEDRGRTALSLFLAVPHTVANSDRFYADAFDFARSRRLPSIYDALYVVLARDLGCDLWTADRRLLDSLGTAAPWVRFIGDYQGAT